MKRQIIVFQKWRVACAALDRHLGQEAEIKGERQTSKVENVDYADLIYILIFPYICGSIGCCRLRERRA
jgi:hypothetical protein